MKWKKYVTLGGALAFALALSPVQASPVAATGVSASAYVQDGLVSQWDGIDNAGTGTHDSSSSIWKDLKGSLDMTLTAKGSWVDGAALYANSGCAAKGTAATPAYKTIEVVYKMTASGGRILFASGNTTGGNRRWVIFDADTELYSDGAANNIYVPVKLETDVIKSYACVYNDNVPASVATNGIVIANPPKQSNTWGIGEAVVMVGDRASSSTWPWKGNVYAIRLYSRQLSALEIVLNSNLDAIRFCGATPESLTWPDGYRYNSTTGQIECRTAIGVFGQGAVSVAGGAAAETNEHWAVMGSANVSVQAVPSAGYHFAVWTGDTEGLDITSATLSVPPSRARSLTARFYQTGETSVRFYPLEYVEGSGAQWVDTEQPLACGQTFRLLWSQNPSIGFNSAGGNGAWGVDTYTHGWEGAGFRQSCSDGYPMTVYHGTYLGFDPAFNYASFVLGDVYEDVCRVDADYFSYTMCHVADGKIGNLTPVANGEGASYVTASSIKLLRNAATSSGNFMSYKRVHGATLFNSQTGAGVFNLVPVEREEDQLDGTILTSVMLYDTVSGTPVTNMTKTALIAGPRTTANGARWNAGKMELVTSVSVDGEGTFSIGGGTAQAQVEYWTNRTETVTLKATPGTGQYFVGWGGDVAPDARYLSEITLTVDRARSLVARFAPTADEHDYWTFTPTGLLCHGRDGIVLKARVGMGNLTLQGVDTLPTNSTVDLTHPIYSEDLRQQLLLTKLADQVFYNNTHLRHIKLPDTLKVIGRQVFQNCKALELVRMSQQIEIIGGDSFAGVGNEKGTKPFFYPEPVFPPSLTNVGYRAFKFALLTNDTVVLSNPKLVVWGSETWGRTLMRRFDASQCGITSIDTGVLYGNSKLKEFLLPKVLTAITATGNFLGGCSALTGVYFSGKPVSFPASNSLGALNALSPCWYLPKWDKDWEEYLADPVRAQRTEMTAKACENYVATHGAEAMPVESLKMGTPSASAWVAGGNPMGIRWWYPNPPPTYEDVNYFDILAWEGTNAVASAGAETLVDGTTWTVNSAQTQYVWSNAANASVTIELPEAATNARALKLTGYRLHQACIEKTTVGKVTTQHRPNGRAPTAWKLEGRLTESGEWVTVDEVEMTGASAQRWAYFGYDTYSETVPVRTNGWVTYAVPAAKQEAYRAFRFTPTKSYNTENGVADATPIALTEIEFIGQVTTAEPMIDSFVHSGSGWNTLSFTGNVSGLGDDLAKGEHATAAWGWVEVADDAAFGTIISTSPRQSVVVSTDQEYEVASLAGKSSYWARFVVSNDLNGVATKALATPTATLDQPWAAETPVCSYDADSNVVVTVGITAKYCAGDLTVKVYGSESLTGEYTLLVTTNLTDAGAHAVATGWTSDSASACVRVEVSAEGITSSTVAGVQGFWIANAASAPTSISNLVTCATFAVTASGTNLTLSSLVDLGSSTKVDLACPIVSADGTATFALESVGTAFKQNIEVAEVVLPGAMTTLAESAFSSCYGLLKVRLPQKLEKISQNAFYDCANLAELEPCLPPCCTNFGPSAFYNCDALKAVRIPKGTTQLASSLFYQCSNLGDVWLPDSLVKLDGGAFWGCGALSNVYPRPVPHNVTSVGTRTYKFDYKLLPKTLVADCEGTLTLSEETFNRTAMEVVDFGGCGGLKLDGNSSLTVGDSGTASFRRLVLPPNTDFNGMIMFGTTSGCGGVTNVTFMGEPPVNVTADPFVGASADLMYVVPDNVKYDIAWRRYLAAHPDWVQEMTVADRTAFRQAFPGERHLPKVKLQLGGVGPFRYLQRLTPRPLTIILR